MANRWGNSVRFYFSGLQITVDGDCSHEVGCINIYNYYIFFLDWSFDPYVMSFLISCNLFFYFKVYFICLRIATSTFFWFPFAGNVFSHPFTVSLYASLGLKWVSCRQHIHGSCFCIHVASLFLLVGAFSPFTFKVPIAIFLIVWGLFM